MRPEPGHDTTTVAAIGSPFRSGHIAWRELDPSISEAWVASTCVRSSRHVRRWPRGPTRWMREAVLLSHEFELDVIDGTPEPILTGLIRLHDRMSSLAGVSAGVTVGRIISPACLRAWRLGESSQQPTCVQVVHRLRWTQDPPSRRQSTHPAPLASFVAIESRCVQMSAIDTPATAAPFPRRARAPPSAATAPRARGSSLRGYATYHRRGPRATAATRSARPRGLG